MSSQTSLSIWHNLNVRNMMERGDQSRMVVRIHFITMILQKIRLKVGPHWIVTAVSQLETQQCEIKEYLFIFVLEFCTCFNYFQPHLDQQFYNFSCHSSSVWFLDLNIQGFSLKYFQCTSQNTAPVLLRLVTFTVTITKLGRV